MSLGWIALVAALAACGDDDAPMSGTDAGAFDAHDIDTGRVEADAGPSPCALACDDGNPCTIETCSEDGICITTLRDADGDGHGDSVCGGDDCDDADPDRYAGADEVCDEERDEDCDPTTFGTSDADADGYIDAACCNVVDGASTCGNDCDDTENGVHPDLGEICNARDDDCNGMIDDGVRLTFYRDVDGDGFGRPDETTEGCSAPPGWAVRAGDCDDATASTNPGAMDTCNGRDDDCDGTPDPGCACTLMMTRMCGTTDVGECSIGTQRCIDGAWGECVGGVLPVAETCNSFDDDCDGTADDGVSITCYADADGDRYAPATAAATQRCADPSRVMVGNCPAGFTDRMPAPGNRDCDDLRDTAFPGATEVCNGLDDDCDGTADDGAGTLYYRDADGDGYGLATMSMRACTAPAMYVLDSTDCNDGAATAHPGAMESCMGTLDEDCDGLVNEGCTCMDGDMQACGLSSMPPCRRGTQRCMGGAWLPCEGHIDPAPESCNMLDDDCNGVVDDGVGMMQWRDADGDMFGDPAVVRLGCTMLGGYVYNDDDCNDSSASIRPGATEVCDNIDHDCDGMNDAVDPNAETWCTTRPHTSVGAPGADQCRLRMSIGRNACQLQCANDYFDCNGTPGTFTVGQDVDGCETAAGASNCGACGHSCSGGLTCQRVETISRTVCACDAPCGMCFSCGAGSCCYEPFPGGMRDCLVGSSC